MLSAAAPGDAPAVEFLVGDNPDAVSGPDRCQPCGVRSGSSATTPLSRFSPTRWESRHPSGSLACGRTRLLWRRSATERLESSLEGGPVKKNIKMLATLAVALALFLLVVRFFPLHR